MAPVERLVLVSLFILTVAALGIALYAAWAAQKARTDLEAWKQREVLRERRRANLGPPTGSTDRRRHGHPDPTVRARRRDADDPRFEQRPAPGPRHRHPDEQPTTELASPTTQALPRPGAIRREQ